jgi:hypothetical protein
MPRMRNIHNLRLSLCLFSLSVVACGGDDDDNVVVDSAPAADASDLDAAEVDGAEVDAGTSASPVISPSGRLGLCRLGVEL